MHPRGSPRSGSLVAFALFVATVASGDARSGGTELPPLRVDTSADSGPGSLRAVLAEAIAEGGSRRIELGERFREPRTVTLSAPLPRIENVDITLDGRIDGVLWKAYGLTISGDRRLRPFEVAPGAGLTLLGITIADGRAERGGAVSSAGRLALEGVTLLRNRAEHDGGAVASHGDTVIVNSTASGNQARRGGAIAALGGSLRVTNSTLADNEAGSGAALYAGVPLQLANSILSGAAPLQCVSESPPVADSGNLITGHLGCGSPVWQGEPRLDPPGYYNGPTPTMPLGTGSPAINLGDNAAAIGVDGKPLVWDQRGNGDPRFVAGHTDIGAYENQSFPHLVVDTVEDNGLRACTYAGAADCPLRAALELAAASRGEQQIRFHPAVFDQPRVLRLAALPPEGEASVLLDGEGVAPVTIELPATASPQWRTANGVRLDMVGGAAAGSGRP